jgi:hypothetical protein
MLLDALVRLATDDTFPRPLPLDAVAREYAGLEITKDDPFRLRYREIIGADWAAVEEGFFTYAIRDSIVTLVAHRELRRRALALAERHKPGELWPDAGERFGLLTETLQVKKAIALAAVGRNGMAVDLAWVRRHEADLRRRLHAAVADVRGLCPDLYKLDADGRLRTTGTGAPSRSRKALGARLATIREEIEAANHGVRLRVPLTAKKNEPTTSTEFWADYKELHPFLAAWTEAEELAKLLQFFAHLQAGRVHPRYTTLVRSGRSSCSSPNVQQMPRDGSLRQAFVASPGHHLLAADCPLRPAELRRGPDQGGGQRPPRTAHHRGLPRAECLPGRGRRRRPGPVPPCRGSRRPPEGPRYLRDELPQGVGGRRQAQRREALHASLC